jgi:hypothetical protein
MTTLSNSYPTEAEARRAIEAMRATGPPPDDIRLLVGRRPGDVRREPVGGFAGPVAPDAPVGTFGDRRVLRRQGAGGFAGDPARQRQGSFADTDRVVIVAHTADGECARVTGLAGARRLLSPPTLDRDTVDGAARELQTGHPVVLVDVRETVASEAHAQVERVARAA